jgi:hypothetical protein
LQITATRVGESLSAVISPAIPAPTMTAPYARLAGGGALNP